MKIIRPITITDAMLTSSNVPETDYTAYNAGTTYASGDHCIITTGHHKIYVSLQSGNLNNNPPDNLTGSTPYWAEVSATNVWKVFDNRVGDQTTQATSITYKITAGEIFDSIAFLNIKAETVQIVLTDPIDGEVYNQTIQLLTTAVTGLSEPIDWYTYFFSSFVTITDCVKFDIPPYLSGVLDITISGTTAFVGEIVIGSVSNLGKTLGNPKVSIFDYSSIATDTWGIYSITERSYSKKLDCTILVESYATDDVYNILAEYRAKPLVWVASEDYSSLIAFGFCKEFNNTFTHNFITTLSLSIQGLT